MAISSRTSVQQSKSRYTQGGDTEVFERRLGWWERLPLEKSSDDMRITLSVQYDKRPDRLAADYFGSSAFMWLVLQYNSIVDINEEFVAGKEIRLPEVSRGLITFTGRRTGGVEPAERD